MTADLCQIPSFIHLWTKCVTNLMLERLSCNSYTMGSGASVLSINMEQYTTRERHVRLSRPGRPFDGHVVIITVSRIPEVELDVADAALIASTRPQSETDDNAYDYDYAYDVSDTETRIAESRQF